MFPLLILIAILCPQRGLSGSSAVKGACFPGIEYLFRSRGRHESSVSEIQLDLGAFDPANGALCDGNPDLNGFLPLCYRCPFADRTARPLRCREYDLPIRARGKYALKGWKKVRTLVLERDGNRCVICSGQENLHIHHIDGDNTHDSAENLVTLCEFCHARVHTELRREGGHERVARVLDLVRAEKRDA